MWVLFLLAAWAAALLACGRLCLAASAAARPADRDGAAGPGGPYVPTLYETAFLAGGPGRVTDLALVVMERQQRLLLARTGWATVVDPLGRDELERSLISAIGPGGQAPVPEVRSAHAGTDAVAALDGRLTEAGLAVPAPRRAAVLLAVRQVRGACAVVLLTGAAAALAVPPASGWQEAAAWFSLPLLMTVTCLGFARIETPPYTRWASPAGQDVLRRAAAGPPCAAPDALTALAVHGRRALPDADLRAALAPGPRGGGGPGPTGRI
ncbi:TIGR04222 domain-containing membrane protein [Streptomyces gamaensis]|uniref:TIGR04222 domain-containing membrane protein n=1 Tax=Streptomyces gamaensis TaxID=1763542 RepID=A0ABW0Z8W8_9ACTN